MTAENADLRKWINILAFILVVIVNGLAGGTTLIGGVNTAQISDKYPTLLTPAGYIFSIWGIIYILLTIFCVYQVLPSQRGKDFQSKIGWFFFISCLANVCWLFLWQFEFLSISTVVMFLLLVSLVSIYLRLKIGIVEVNISEKLAVHTPFSVYLGWITIATIANVSAALVSVGWNSFSLSDQTWATLMVVTALIITSLVIFTRKDLAYSLVIIWALQGISFNQGTNQTVVIITEAASVIVVILLAIIVLIPKLRKG
jgi:benzodiazapine receptor